MTALLDKLKARPHRSATKHAGQEDSDLREPSGCIAGATRLRETTSDAAAPDMSFTYAPGSTPLPRYTVRRGIGIGGFGEVYFAVSDAGKEVALKRIQRNLDVELRGVSHCLNLKHPNLVSLYDVCRDAADQAWVVMEYIAGPNLRDVLDEAPNGLPDSEVRRWFASIVAGVGHLHSAGLVHRDLKPGNVFDDLGVVKVGDYGLSKFISASHRGGHTESVGTFHYMAPEIGRGEYGREIDVYALGIMLYELLTGQVPFDGESCHEIIVKHLTATPDLSRVAHPYRGVISRALQKDPQARFSHVVDMLGALQIVTPGITGVVARGIETTPATAVPEMEPGEPVEARIAGSGSGAAGTGQPHRNDHRSSSHSGKLASGEPLVAGTRGDAAVATFDEPLARAVRSSFADLSRWWSSLDRSPGAKAFLGIAAAVILLINTHWLLPLMSVVAAFYVPYYIIRQMVLHSNRQPSYAEAQRTATKQSLPYKPSRAEWRAQMRANLQAKRAVHRVAELSTSWTVATMTAIGLVVAAGAIGLRNGPVEPLTVAPYGWIAIMVLLSSLGILGLGKLWEPKEGKGLLRRLVLGTLGAGVGIAGYGLLQFLMLPSNVGVVQSIDNSDLPKALYVDGSPMASAMMAHFAILFAVVRWWKPVDPLRRTRLSLWSVAVAVVVEWALHQLIPIPQPAGMLVAGGIAIAVQMSAPWIDPRAEARLRAGKLASTGGAA